MLGRTILHTPFAAVLQEGTDPNTVKKVFQPPAKLLYYREKLFNLYLAHCGYPLYVDGDDANLCLILRKGIPRMDYDVASEHVGTIPIWKGIVDSILWLHQHGVYHGDIKLNNFVWYEKKIWPIDFGCARFGMGDRVHIHWPAYCEKYRIAREYISWDTEAYALRCMLITLGGFDGQLKLFRAISNCKTMMDFARLTGVESNRLPQARVLPDLELNTIASRIPNIFYYGGNRVCSGGDNWILQLDTHNTIHIKNSIVYNMIGILYEGDIGRKIPIKDTLVIQELVRYFPLESLFPRVSEVYEPIQSSELISTESLSTESLSTGSFCENKSTREGEFDRESRTEEEDRMKVVLGPILIVHTDKRVCAWTEIKTVYTHYGVRWTLFPIKEVRSVTQTNSVVIGTRETVDNWKQFNPTAFAYLTDGTAQINGSEYVWSDELTMHDFMERFIQYRQKLNLTQPSSSSTPPLPSLSTL